MRDEIYAMHDEIRMMRDEMQTAAFELQNVVTANDTHLQMLAFALDGAEGESYEMTRERFFMNLPKPSGIERLIQLADLQLLCEFDSFCNVHGLTYWMMSGTLLGAVRHKGFIPWDDDIDLGMLRSDIEQLIELTKNDERFETTEVFDYCVTCRQVRFRYRRVDIPCFLDLFIYDLCTLEAEKALEPIKQDRARLKNALDNEKGITTWGTDRQFIDSSTDEGSLIRSLFDGVIESAYSDSGYLTSDPSKAKSAVWAADNFDGFTGRSHNFAFDVVFPVARIPFEDFVFSAPNDSESALLTLYGDYLALPKDIGTHITHVSKEVIDSPSIRSAIHELAQQTGKV